MSSLAPWILAVAAPIVAGVFLLAGSQMSRRTILEQEKLRLERDKDARWLADRRSVYVDFLSKSNDCVGLLFRATEETYDRSALLNAAYALKTSLMALQLIATEPVRDAAAEVSNTIGGRMQFVVGTSGLMSVDRELPRDMDVALEHFYEVTRLELGVQEQSRRVVIPLQPRWGTRLFRRER
ncbi:hypothetical protein ABZ777_21985 [Micromonospora parva]|uniref:hypothetical protein n=1 Tax=Micromonospora parva TaxID=1464048 RepID=UPI00340A772D